MPAEQRQPAQDAVDGDGIGQPGVAAVHPEDDPQHQARPGRSPAQVGSWARTPVSCVIVKTKTRSKKSSSVVTRGDSAGSVEARGDSGIPRI